MEDEGSVEEAEAGTAEEGQEEGGQTVKVEGRMLRGSVGRDEAAQAGLVGKMPGEHAGHLIAHEFLGPGQAINLIPMSRYVNLVDWRGFERRIGSLIDEGSAVRVVIDVRYDGPSPRATKIVARYEIDGSRHGVWSSDPVLIQDP